jgi:hypothetical protein
MELGRCPAGEHDASLSLLPCDAACPTDGSRCLVEKEGLALGEETICMSSDACCRFIRYGAASQGRTASRDSLSRRKQHKTN